MSKHFYGFVLHVFFICLCSMIIHLFAANNLIWSERVFSLASVCEQDFVIPQANKYGNDNRSAFMDFQLQEELKSIKISYSVETDGCDFPGCSIL